MSEHPSSKLPAGARASQDSLEAQARRLAEERHAGQQYGPHPYGFHLAQVRAVLEAFGYGGELGIAAWLHDTVEDTATTREEIASLFGQEVAALVWAVTGIGQNRRERNGSAYEKIRQHPRAAILKLADRIANAEASRGHPDKLAMYRKEQEAFAQALSGLGDARMWDRLRTALEE
jgi:(p)ppGpp synthase/HD superfamily hydrolase